MGLPVWEHGQGGRPGGGSFQGDYLLDTRAIQKKGITYQITKHLIFATPASLTSHNLNHTNYTEGSLHA